jgi:hypothetical protein
MDAVIVREMFAETGGWNPMSSARDLGQSVDSDSTIDLSSAASVSKRELRAAASEFSKAYEDEVPTFAPTRFAEALTLWKRAQTEAPGRIDPSRLDDLLREARSSLSVATAVADRSRELLSELVGMRIASMRNDGERFFAPGTLKEAEAAYRSAILAAENDDSRPASEHAAGAQRLFREASLRFLEHGLISHLERELSEAVLSPSDDAARRAVEQDLGHLRDAMAKSGGEATPVAMLRRQFAATRRGARALLDASVGLGGDDVLAPGDDWAPGTFGPPEAPLTMSITARFDDRLRVTWRNRSGGDTNYLLRQEGGGPWQVVAEFGGLTGWTTHTDSGLMPDTRYSYRVRSEGPYGQSTTPLDNRASGHTRGDPTIEVWRLQLRVRTADVSDAGTDNAMQVRLNSPLVTHQPNQHSTWMDYGPRPVEGTAFFLSDDFARGRDFTYDLMLRHPDRGRIRELTDITMLTLRKDGSDGVGIAEIELLVNGVRVFERFFGETASTCLWLDEGDGSSPTYTIDYPELRAHDAWGAFVNSPPTPPLRISNEEMVSRIEGIIGDQLHGTPAYWGHLYGADWVTASRLDDETLLIDADLSADIPGNDPEIDINLALHFEVTCDNGVATLTMTTENFTPDVDFDWWQEWTWFLEDNIEDAMKESFQPITQIITVDAGGLCPTVRIDQDGNVNFELGN